MEEKNNSMQVGDNEIEDLAAGRSTGPARDSSGAALNRERLVQEEEGFRVFSEETEKLPNEGLGDGEILATDGSPTDTIRGVDDDPKADTGLDVVMGNESDVTEDDLVALGSMDQDMDEGEDEEISTSAVLDDKDNDGDPLNEASTPAFATGDDLDTGDIDQNDPDGDSMGQGDEENSYYSLGSDDNDNVTEGTP